MTEDLYYEAMQIKSSIMELDDLDNLISREAFSVAAAHGSVLIDGVLADEIRDKIKPIVAKYRKKLQKKFDEL